MLSYIHVLLLFYVFMLRFFQRWLWWRANISKENLVNSSYLFHIDLYYMVVRRSYFVWIKHEKWWKWSRLISLVNIRNRKQQNDWKYKYNDNFYISLKINFKNLRIFLCHKCFCKHYWNHRALHPLWKAMLIRWT